MTSGLVPEKWRRSKNRARLICPPPTQKSCLRFILGPCNPRAWSWCALQHLVEVSMV